ncbi:3-keto-disaccharide hydrolase [Christiangramia echinicola]|uniref:3-keto-alpha-glucoside-1,2-lyase/3-keto-2-hydroxy-glucal hydratase domain-containing protein n=1 Tax=Christiangramia echinicola TaxID=279359 RepID=A0A1H1KTP9_9FLAO|nr:DUF1080 domain-containing protein [Christiangramia echinicola]SDR65402.1 protein of unknown function [Christiangramia echinicola]
MKRIILIGCSILALTSCKNEKKESQEVEVVKTEKMEAKTNENKEWKVLFSGEDLEGWQTYNRDSISSQWKVEDDAISFAPAKGDKRIKEYLMTKDKYENFELQIEWKISEGGNSGILYGVQEMDKYDEPYYTGPEIQILDNQKHPDAKNGLNRTAGALYDMVPPNKDVTKSAGEWNKEVIHIDHKENIGWVKLNGVKVTEFPVNGEKWKNMVQNSKFSQWEDFGTSSKGYIALQDHDDKVWFRNIKIKEL